MRIQLSSFFMGENCSYEKMLILGGRDLGTEGRSLFKVQNEGRNLGLTLHPMHSVLFLGMTRMRTKCLLGIHLFRQESSSWKGTRSQISDMLIWGVATSAKENAFRDRIEMRDEELVRHDQPQSFATVVLKSAASGSPSAMQSLRPHLLNQNLHFSKIPGDSYAS